METVKDIKDFKRFIELNRNKLYASAENANDIAMQIKIENFLLHFSS